MFDVAFTEIILICIVALIVLGPDKLPGTIRVLGLWLGRLKRSFNNIKTEIEKEVGADEIRRQLRNEEIMEKIKKTKSDFNNTVSSVKKEATDSIKPEGLDELKKDFDSITGKGSAKSGSSATGTNTDAGKSETGSTDTASPTTTESSQEQAKAQPAASGTDTDKKPGTDKSES